MTTIEFQKEFTSNAAMPETEDPGYVVSEYARVREIAIKQAFDLGVGSEGMGDVKKKLSSAFIAGHSFLLDFYDTPDEQPIEHLIREFSSGKIG
jgi:hypothetical protein